MTLPKLHLPGQVVMIGRRCTQRQYLLRNSRSGALKNCVGYNYGLCAIRHHQVVHAVSTMSNHYHGIQTDRAAQRSDFAQDFHHFVCKGVNKILKRRESIWSSGKMGDMVLTDTEAVIESMLYVWLNPVAAGLVDSVDDWDHFQILPWHWGKTMEFERPDFFSGRSSTPEIIRFTPMPPPGLDHLSLRDAIDLCTKLLRRREREIVANRNRPALGMHKVYNISPFSTPKKSTPMYKRNPKFSGKNKQLLSRMISAYKFFLEKYRMAIRLVKAGKRVLFPAGTIRMSRRLRFLSHAPEPGDPSFPRYSRIV